MRYLFFSFLMLAYIITPLSTFTAHKESHHRNFYVLNGSKVAAGIVSCCLCPYFFKKGIRFYKVYTCIRDQGLDTFIQLYLNNNQENNNQERIEKTRQFGPEFFKNKFKNLGYQYFAGSVASGIIGLALLYDGAQNLCRGPELKKK